jgi:hypothetical protein
MGRDIAVDDFFETGLVNWHATRLKGFDLCFIVVDADDVVADVGKTGPGDKTNVARTDDRNIHDEEMLPALNLAQDSGCSLALAAGIEIQIKAKFRKSFKAEG